jgi:hypothetical protein
MRFLVRFKQLRTLNLITIFLVHYAEASQVETHYKTLQPLSLINGFQKVQIDPMATNNQSA